MINSFQKLLYILGTVSPYSIIASICYGCQVSWKSYLTWIAMYTQGSIPTIEQRLTFFIKAIPLVAWILGVISVALLIYHIIFLKMAMRKLAPMDFFPTSTPEENDDFAKGLGVAYLLPVIEWIVTKGIFDIDERANGYFLLVTGVIAVVVSLIVNKSYGSPIYMVAGYHFHTVQTENSKTYILMSRKKHFRNKNQVRRVNRLFEDFLIDAT